MLATDPADVVRAVAAGVSRLIVGSLNAEERERQLDALANLYGEGTDVRHPFAPGGELPMRTRAELRRHFASADGLTSGVSQFEPTKEVVYRTADPELVVFEFAYAGVARGERFELPCIFVVRVRDGQIVESRDYADHLSVAQAFGRWDELVGQLQQKHN